MALFLPIRPVRASRYVKIPPKITPSAVFLAIILVLAVLLVIAVLLVVLLIIAVLLVVLILIIHE